MSNDMIVVGYLVTENGVVEQWSSPQKHVMRSIACSLGMDFHHDVLQNIHGDCMELYYGGMGERNHRVETKTGRVYRGPVLILRRSPMLPDQGHFKSFTSVLAKEEDFEYHTRFDLTDQLEDYHGHLVKTGELSTLQGRYGNPML